MSTPDAIQSGVMWTIVEGIRSFIKDRWKIDPGATIVFTGGDGHVCDVIFDSITPRRRSISINCLAAPFLLYLS